MAVLGVGDAVAGEDPVALGAPCTPSCPLPLPKPDELAVADQAGTNTVAAWLHRQGRGLAGDVRALNAQGKPSQAPFEIEETASVAVSCGPGCRRFSLPSAPRVLHVTVQDAGHAYTAALPTRWQPGQAASARRLLEHAQQVMRALRSARETQTVNSVPGIYAVSEYALRAPDRMMDTNSVLRLPGGRRQAGNRAVVIGSREWDRPPGAAGWQRGAFGGGQSFRVRSWFTWTTYAQAVRLLGVQRERGRRLAVVALMDPGTPAWWRLYVDLASGRVLHDRLITPAHFMTNRYYGLNEPVGIHPPR